MDIFLCASVMFALQFPVLRLLGKCELAQVTPFELVVLIIMVDLIQQGVTHNDFSLTGATLAIGSFAFCGLVLSWMNSRFPRIGRRLEGEPRVIIRAGELVEDSLRRDRMTRAEVEYEIRLAGIAHMREVDWAILEQQDKISFIKRKEDSN